MAISKLREIRNRNKLSQVDMADRLNMSQSAYAKLEIGQTCLRKETIIYLVREFGESASDLLDVDGMQIISTSNVSSSIITSSNPTDLYNHQHEFLEKVILTKDEQIDKLLKVIENLVVDKKI